MSNTGHKGISASYNDKGEIERLQVFVGWKGKARRVTIPGDDLEFALATRRDFEVELKKPHSERRIMAASGVYRASDGQGRWSWTAVINPTPGWHKRYTFSISKYGEARARRMAEEKRATEEAKFYREGSKK